MPKFYESSSEYESSQLGSAVSSLGSLISLVFDSPDNQRTGYQGEVNYTHGQRDSEYAWSVGAREDQGKRLPLNRWRSTRCCLGFVIPSLWMLKLGAIGYNFITEEKESHAFIPWSPQHLGIVCTQTLCSLIILFYALFVWRKLWSYSSECCKCITQILFVVAFIISGLISLGVGVNEVDHRKFSRKLDIDAAFLFMILRAIELVLLVFLIAPAYGKVFSCLRCLFPAGKPVKFGNTLPSSPLDDVLSIEHGGRPLIGSTLPSPTPGPETRPRAYSNPMDVMDDTRMRP